MDDEQYFYLKLDSKIIKFMSPHKGYLINIDTEDLCIYFNFPSCTVVNCRKINEEFCPDNDYKKIDDNLNSLFDSYGQVYFNNLKRNTTYNSKDYFLFFFKREVDAEKFYDLKDDNDYNILELLIEYNVIKYIGKISSNILSSKAIRSNMTFNSDTSSKYPDVNKCTDRQCIDNECRIHNNPDPKFTYSNGTYHLIVDTELIAPDTVHSEIFKQSPVHFGTIKLTPIDSAESIDFETVDSSEDIDFKTVKSVNIDSETIVSGTINLTPIDSETIVSETINLTPIVSETINLTPIDSETITSVSTKITHINQTPVDSGTINQSPVDSGTINQLPDNPDPINYIDTIPNSYDIKNHNKLSLEQIEKDLNNVKMHFILVNRKVIIELEKKDIELEKYKNDMLYFKDNNIIFKMKNEVLKKDNRDLKRDNGDLKKDNEALKKDNEALKEDNKSLNYKNDDLKKQNIDIKKLHDLEKYVLEKKNKESLYQLCQIKKENESLEIRNLKIEELNIKNKNDIARITELYNHSSKNKDLIIEELEVKVRKITSILT